jgi:isochorismate synthase
MSQQHALRSAEPSSVNARAALSAQLDAARVEHQHRAPTDLVLVRLEVPSLAPEALLERFPEHDAVLWHPPEGPRFAGIGVAATIVGQGSERFAQVRRSQDALWATVAAAKDGGEWDAPRLFGGFSFAPNGASSEHWSGFGPARFVLPRISYASHGERASLTLALERRELERPSSEAVATFRKALDVLLSGPRSTAGEAIAPARRREGDPKSFERQVEQLVERIRRGEVQKVVAAREVQLDFEAPLDPVATVVGLRDQAPECLRFSFRTGVATFLGAPPERLLRKRGLALDTEAVAGSIDARAERAEYRLQASAKDLEEHALVVSAITDALAPVCDRPELPARPGVRRLKHLLHLFTPIHARLHRELHVLELIERLHPTPAVGGVPTRTALECIADTESFDRGWYAGAIGWFDAHGNGDFNVALRSGLVRSQRAWLYAGAGIMGESQAALEYAETTWKLAAMLSSLRAR